MQTVHERISFSARSSVVGGTHKLSFRAMSTVCQVQFQTSSDALAREFQSEVIGWVSEFEARYSRFIPESLISRINAAAGKAWLEVDTETDVILNLCQEMNFFTRGIFDPTALPLIQLWNWKEQPQNLPDEAAVNKVKELVGWRKVQRRKGAIFLPREGMCLDLGGIGKEYAVDRVLAMALQRGMTNVLVDFGQDVRVNGKPAEKPAFHIGLDDPKNPGRCWTGLAVTNHAVTTSGDYLRHFVRDGRRFGHIIDPRTGYPVDNGALSVSVIAPTCTFAGILSTAAFVLGAKEGIDLISLCPGAEGCITTQNTLHQSRGFYAYRTS